ncbi:MAG: hypothetical protein V2B15_00215 [Bacteroidota bacterium]
MKFIQPSVELLNVRIDEPITTATDLILAAVCFYAFYRISQQENTGRIQRYFKFYFLTLGLGALFGGLIGHAFLYSLPPSWKLLSWIFTLASVAIIGFALIELSRPLIRPAVSRTVARINLVIMFFALFYTMWTLAFSAVKYYTIFGMVVVVGFLSFVVFQKTRDRGVMMLMFGITVGLLSAVVFSYEWGLGPWFNHNDLSHVILSFSALSLYKGAVLILEAPVNLL